MVAGAESVAHPDRVVVAMSGGVDSSTVAALLVEQGYEVIGVMMRLWAEGPGPGDGGGENRCCTPQAVDDASRVAAQLGIPFHLVDYEAEFKACVVNYFVTEYARGRTPNPCLACNRHVRFGHLLSHAQALGAAYLATGHYARVDQVSGCFRLRMGSDPRKDQSYVLYMLDQDDLQRVLFPLGSYTKDQVRAMARQWDLPVAYRDESMELCFVADDDYRRFLSQHASHTVQPGPILDTAGREIGQHQGLPFYTVGQRRGLGTIARPRSGGTAGPAALYVIRLDVARNALVVGTARELGRRTLAAEEVTYVSGKPPGGAVRVQAKIRYRATLADGTWTPVPDGRSTVEFDSLLRDITPGQAVVAYQGGVVLGGGIISE